MRLKSEISNYLKQASPHHFPDAELYLFGSRVHDQEQGGDIDLLLLSTSKISLNQIRKFRTEFFKNFGWQKLDLVCFTKEQENTFKKIALKNAILITNGRQTE